MKVNKKILIFEISLFLYIILLKIFFIDKVGFYKPILSITFPIITLISYKIFGYQKDKKNNKNPSIQITIIILLSYLLISFLSGLFFGFTESQFDVSFFGIISNIYYLIIMIFCEELIRYIIIKKNYKNNIFSIIFITFIFILLDFFLMYNTKSNATEYEIFLLITTNLLPSIIRNIVSSYLCYHISYIPGLILRLFYSLYNYIFPIYPNVGYYLTSVFGLLVPFIIYFANTKYVIQTKNIKECKGKDKYNHYSIIVVILTLLVAALISGFFKYQIIAIGSGSMSPYINYGDAIVFKHLNKEEEIETLKKGDILVFYQDKKYITHRIVKIYKEENNISFKTKGDNNQDVDSFIVKKKDIVGCVVFKIRYVGNPTLWFNKIFKRL